TTYNVLVVRVEFSPASSANQTGDGTFDGATTKTVVEAFMDKVKDFYTENSYGNLTINYTVTNKYTLPQTMSVYGQDTPYDQYDVLVQDLANHASFINDYPSAALATYDHIMIYHAGAGQESNPKGVRTDDIWSAYVSNLGVTGIDDATFVPEMENQGADPLGVICHEYGHQLGLPDLYYVNDSNVQVSTIGNWSLMDNGVWLGAPQGSNPSHLDAWSKYDLRFIAPVEISGTQSNIELQPAETSGNYFYKISLPVATDPGTEFFLVEFRYAQSTATYDAYIPGSGVLVYHVDNTIAQDTTRRLNNTVNNGVPHRGVDIEEPDGTDSGDNFGDAGDVYGSGSTLFTDPLSRAYNGLESGITLSFSISGATGRMSSTSIDFEQNLSIRELISYPNPTYDGRATIQVRLSRPYQTMEFFMYTLAGEKVKKATDAVFVFDGLKSTDNNWVYEYSWNGTNDDDQDVASGVYFYLIRINDSEVKTNKLAVIK
ncbi:MAG: M6 family metalloprotease domain-containing protein, partial [Elusimicrobia bacterium]|nr:M6 family metalloprotease domain-containing protein [Elusimicrobiota bacterium]MBD3412071.1 M6 family metalloprotease domain-containing protein [Elusimicrobiota bacterium]